MMRTRQQALEDLTKDLIRHAKRHQLVDKCRQIAKSQSSAVIMQDDNKLHIFLGDRLSITYREVQNEPDRVEARYDNRPVFTAQYVNELLNLQAKGRYCFETIKPALLKATLSIKEAYARKEYGIRA